jgi:transcription-repair coupling factor (superfamily II helicase)
MRDRFGALPPNVENLFHFVRVKWLAKQLGVLSIVREGARGVMKLTAHAKIDPNKLLRFIGENPQARFSPNGVLSFPMKGHGADVIDAIEQMLQTIAA